MRYRDIQEATATRKLTHGTDRGRMNEVILATAIFSKCIFSPIELKLAHRFGNTATSKFLKGISVG